MNTKKAILVVSFGTSYEETRKKTIDEIEIKIAKAFPDYMIYRAFTSKMIIKKIKKEEKLHINTVTEALQDMINDGIEELIIQPTHVINGIENTIMIDDLQEFLPHFKSVRMGNPLLTTTEDYKNVISIIKDNFSFVKNDEALVFMGHGTSHFSNSSYAALDYMFKDSDCNNIFVGTVEGYPEIDSVLKFVKRFNAKKVYLTPFMIVAGDHAENDMASLEEEDSWNNVFKNEGYDVECVLKGLGEYEAIQDIFIQHINESIRIK